MMASSDRTPPGFRRTDPDETLGRLLYRERADAEARMRISLARQVKLKEAGSHG
ncbi:MAG: hypothetical protein JWQ97_995 [Phenylobacterium sp.]|nr:hypothetical protein [Phenylobacterium sp.]